MPNAFGQPIHCVYVLFSIVDGLMYIGHSSHLRERLADHCAGKVQSTAARRPLELIHVEYYLSDRDARRREEYLKTTKGKRALKLMLRESLAEIRARMRHET